MSLPLIRYPLDRTGINKDNLVFGELHDLHTVSEKGGPLVVRNVVPKYGPFYTSSIEVYDQITNNKLVKGIDYQCVEILQEATLKFGKEIAQLVLIINENVSSKVRVSYQTLGGLYQFDVSSIATMYETAMKDNRAVDWLNVLNKPLAYPPTLHNHTLDDVYGFEYVVVALERIRNAIVLSDVPAFEALIEWVKSRSPEVVTYEEIDNRTPVNKMVTFEKLLYFMNTLDYCQLEMKLSCKKFTKNFSDIKANLDLSCNPSSSGFYWTIEHINTKATDFITASGKIDIVNKHGEFTIKLGEIVKADLLPKQFKIQIRRNSLISKITMVSDVITVLDKIPGDDIVEYMTACCVFKPTIEINAASMFIIGENENA